MVRMTSLLAVLALFSLAAAGGPADSAVKKEMNALVGRWEVLEDDQIPGKVTFTADGKCIWAEQALPEPED